MASDSADKVTTLRGINVQFLPSNYLGVPLRGKPLSKRFWTNISDKIHKKMSSWKYSYLSKGGKITLINSSLVSLPIYQLFVFKALVSTYKAIEKTWRNFFWNHSEEDRKMHLIRWSVITSPKDKGGLDWLNMTTLFWEISLPKADIAVAGLLGIPSLKRPLRSWELDLWNDLKGSCASVTDDSCCDKPVWKLNTNGTFSVASAKKAVHSGDPGGTSSLGQSTFQNLWRASIPKKWKFFI
ncbi:LINE-1 retrotransposable element ORF2 protein [Cucumis melo var. makuwa]|uniref:LINE-1 retrotransposable element ORF2 protein n=1 Tax=Cucumis melo var. makuwa TaxID=1194695 RepID=A0A5A7UTU7_CUCMM|nr:LINE-1 retrotransposable element ORF2 protein [Cucumis melo var. makuwa]TYK26395.1 LINE-1 retrotransposable element ORF2 protein [Cucumis melo var. makuwa]